MMDGLTISAIAARQIRAAMRTIDEHAKALDALRLRLDRQGASIVPTIYIGKTGGSPIAARSGDTLSSGSVTLYGIDGDSGLYVAQDSVSEDDLTVAAYNLSTGEVAADTFVMVLREAVTYKYLIGWEECP